MPDTPFNIIEKLKSVVDNAFTYQEFGLFCQRYEDEIRVNFARLLPVTGTAANHLDAFIMALKKNQKIGQFIDVLKREKPDDPDIGALSKQWSHLFEKDNSGSYQFKKDAFDLIFFWDNNEDLPFIAREDFKESIRKAINARSLGSLRLAVNGAKGVGITYLKEYLTQLNRNFNCFSKYITIDCDEELDKKNDEIIQPVHIAECLLYKLKMEKPGYIDLNDPSKFKKLYYLRFFDDIKAKCEADGEAIVLFIDHLPHDMGTEVFQFFDSFLEKIKEFKVPYLLILGGMVSEKLSPPDAVKEITLETFKEQDIRDYLGKVYRYLKSGFPTAFADSTEENFINAVTPTLLEDIIQEGHFVPVKDTQRYVKLWYEELLKTVKPQER